MASIGCYIYTRVSTSMQVDGYSLDAQKDKLKKYADYMGMKVLREYSDEGKSGKNIEGRPSFLRMLNDIERKLDDVKYILVFKLSRFGRNAADVLTSLQLMQDYGVNLICVEDGIDSSKDSGKLMISVLSAVAEIERENILVQTMEGRRQKAREGKWNGGMAPYGYKLVNGFLEKVPEEAEIIKFIFDKYAYSNMGAGQIAKALNNKGVIKQPRLNTKLPFFTSEFIVKVIDNPIYMGMISYGRRSTEKIDGTRNKFRTVRKSEFMLNEGVHEGIVTKEVWEIAKKKRDKSRGKHEKKHSLEHEHILSGIVKCPICGAGMYGRVNRKKKRDGTYYPDYFYYCCSHRTPVDGKQCNYNKQIGEVLLDTTIVSIIKDIVRNPMFAYTLKQALNSEIDISNIEKEKESLQKRRRQIEGAKNKLAEKMDLLDIDTPSYHNIYDDMEKRLYKLYNEIDEIDVLIQEIDVKINNVKGDRITFENVYKMFEYFEEYYETCTDAIKKELMGALIESIELYPEKRPDGRLIKAINFAFPIKYDLDSDALNFPCNFVIDETIVLLQRKTSQN